MDSDELRMRESLDNAVENGYDMTKLSPVQIMVDLWICDADAVSVPEYRLIKIVENWLADKGASPKAVENVPDQGLTASMVVNVASAQARPRPAATPTAPGAAAEPNAGEKAGSQGDVTVPPYTIS